VLRLRNERAAAEKTLRAAISLAHDQGKVSGEAGAWRSLAQLHQADSQHEEAQVCFDHALRLYGLQNLEHEILATRQLMES
jgi:tetratricopeptide (TPR) repeat protein